MSDFKSFSFYSFVLLILISCKDQRADNAYQIDVINNYLQGQLVYEYYADSTIKQVSEVNEKNEQYGRIVQFTTEGIIKRIFFINNEGDTVGDDSRFELGNLDLHFFRLNSEDLLFYAKFSENGELIFSEGHPFFLSGQSEVSRGDTISFYIACPIIPGFQTYVTFGQNGYEKSKVNYINDMRQFTYRKVMSNKGEYEFHLKIQIKDSLEKVIIEYLDTTQVIVN